MSKLAIDLQGIIGQLENLGLPDAVPARHIKQARLVEQQYANADECEAGWEELKRFCVRLSSTRAKSARTDNPT